MTRRSVATLVGALSLSLLFAPILASPAQAAAGTAKITASASGTDVWKNDVVNLVVDFPTGKYDEGTYGNYPYLSVFSSTDNTNFAKVATGVKSDKAGKLTLTYNVGTSASWAKVCNDKTKPNGQAGKLFNDGTTEICTTAVAFDPQDPPPSGVALTVAPDGKTATATFSGAAMKSGQAANLQIATIVTDMTGEVTASTWKNIASGKQDAKGVVKFTVADPYEVSHDYRAVSGKFTSDPVKLDQAALSASMGKKNTGVPQLYFNTNEQAKVNTRTKWFEGRFTMKQADGSITAKFGACDTPVKDKDGKTVDSATKPLTAALKGRGNYSWSFAKKSFSLKLDKRSNLCDMGANKKWALVANHYDKSLLRNTAGHYIGSKLTNLAWSAKSVPVDFWVNGAYQGSYILIERVTPDTKTPRIPYDAVDDQTKIAAEDTPGFLLEWDFRKGADYNFDVNKHGWIGVKDPENDYDKKTGVDKKTGITTDQKKYISAYVKACDKKLYASNFTHPTNGWRSCIDEASAVDFYIGHEVMKTVDGNMWASVYMWKPKDGKLMMGPLWDFDLAAGSANRAGGAVNPTGFYLRNVIKMSAKSTDKTWFNRLNEDAGFRAAVKARWKVVGPQIKTVDSFLAAESGRISASANENFKKWSITRKDSSVQVVKGSWSSEVSYLRSWLKTRMTWLDSNF